METPTTQAPATTFNRWLDRFVDEKAFDLDATVDAGWGTPTLAAVVHALRWVPNAQGKLIKDQLVRADFANVDCLPVFGRFAQFLDCPAVPA